MGGVVFKLGDPLSIIVRNLFMEEIDGTIRGRNKKDCFFETAIGIGVVGEQLGGNVKILFMDENRWVTQCKNINFDHKKMRRENAMFKTVEAAEYLGMSMSTLEAWRVRGGGPKFLKFGRAVRYRLGDLEHFISERIRRNTSNKKD